MAADISRGRTPIGSTVGLVLPGGGARAAYQVGVLKGIAAMYPPGAHNPFPIIVGTSAGAVSAAVLATEAFRWQHAVESLESVLNEGGPDRAAIGNCVASQWFPTSVVVEDG